MFNEDYEYSGISWSYQWNSMFGWGSELNISEECGVWRGKAPERRWRKGKLCEVCRLYLCYLCISVLYMWGMQVISAQKYLAHMSSVADNPNIRFAETGSVPFGFSIITQQSNVSTSNYISIEICGMLGHVGAGGFRICSSHRLECTPEVFTV